MGLVTGASLLGALGWYSEPLGQEGREKGQAQLP